MNNRLNKYKYPGAKRLMLEAQELKDKTEDYCAQPIEDNLFEWHFTVRGPPDTAFDGGFYHGRLSFPTDYPMKPPSIILLTPNGRFETNKKICLSISGYHPETWQPSWSVRTALLALIAFMPTKANRAIGSLDFSDAERRKLATKSRTWRCETCGLIKDLLKHPGEDVASSMENSDENEKAGKSRVNGGSSSTSSDRSDSDGEERDSSSDSHRSSTSADNSNSNDDTTTHSTKHRSRFNPDLKQQQQRHQQSSNNYNDRANEPRMLENQSTPTSSREPPLSQSIEEQVAPGPATQQALDGRRAYTSSVVLKSIFVLLSLLILRRVVMVIQT